MVAHAQPLVVLITGASSGIGRATAERFARAGNHLALVAREPERLARVAEACAAAGASSVLVQPADVGADAEVAGAVRGVLARYGRIDVAVNAAGVVAYGRVEEVPAEVFEKVLRTNLVGSINLTRHVLPALRAQRAGTILYVGSVVGHMAVPTMSPYVLSKWGVRALARHVALENRDLPGVRVRYVAPGAVDTPIYDEAANYNGYAAQPPAPVASAGKAAGQVVRRLGRVPLPVQLSVLNYAMTVGFAHLPRVYDAIVGPLFARLGQDRSRRVADTTGNVLSPRAGARAPVGRGSAGLP